MNKKILVNKAKCKHCGDVIESKTVHDYRVCKCKKISVDGGHDYLSRNFPKLPWEDHFEDLSVIKYVCSHCHFEFDEEELNKLIKSQNGTSYKYCPNCGEFVVYD